MTFNDARFNQDGSCICVANDKGFKILNSNPLVVTCDRDLRNKHAGSIGMVEMLYRSNLLALVGNSEYYDIRKNSIGTLFNTFIKPWRQNVVTIWDDKKMTEVAQLVFNSSVVNMKMLYDLLVVVLGHKAYVYQMSDFTLVECSNTTHNPFGVCAVASFRGLNIIAYPGKFVGTIVTQIYSKTTRKVKVAEALEGEKALDVFEFSDILASGERASKYVKVTLKLNVHRSEITSVDLSPNGLLLVTSSLGGHFIKMFDTLSGELIQVFRKSTHSGRVVKCAVDKQMQWMAVVTDRPRLHVYAIDPEAVRECHFEDENRRLDFRHSCIFDINSEDTDVGRYFRHYRYSIANPVTRCGDYGLCRGLVNRARLFIHCAHPVLTFRPPHKERILDCSVLTERQTIVIVLQGGRAMKLFFNPAKSARLKMLFYHNL